MRCGVILPVLIQQSVMYTDTESVEILNMQRRGHVQLGFARDSGYTCNNSRQAEKRTIF